MALMLGARRDWEMRTRSMSSPEASSILKNHMDKANISSRRAVQLPNSSDESSGTAKCLQGCSSPGCDTEDRTSPVHMPAHLPAVIPGHDRSPAPSPVTPLSGVVASAAMQTGFTVAHRTTPDLEPAAASTAAVKIIMPALSAGTGDSNRAGLQPLCPPEAAEGAGAAAEYEAYKQRWAAGCTLAQRWERLAESGKAANIRHEWEDMQLDWLLQQHCSNTPQAKAARAAAAAAVSADASVPLLLRSTKSRRRSRSEPEGDAAAAVEECGAEAAFGAAEAPVGRRVRARHTPKSFRDFEVDLPSPSSPSSGAAALELPAPSGTAAAVFFPTGQQQQQQAMDVYIGAGILWDLHQASAQTLQNPEQPLPHVQEPKQHKTQQQQQQQQPLQSQQQYQQVQPPLHHSSTHKVKPLPPVAPRPQTRLVLDLSSSPRLAEQPAEPVAAAAGRGSAADPVDFGSSKTTGAGKGWQHPPAAPKPTLQHGTAGTHLAATPGLKTAAPQRQQQQQQQQHLARQLQLPPRPPSHVQLHKQQQQPQQQAALQAPHVQSALQVASQLGAALGHNYEAFAQVVSFVSQNSDQPAVLYQFMSATLSQLQSRQAPAGLQAAPSATAEASPSQQQQQRQQQQKELML